MRRVTRARDLRRLAPRARDLNPVSLAVSTRRGPRTGGRAPLRRPAFNLLSLGSARCLSPPTTLDPPPRRTPGICENCVHSWEQVKFSNCRYRTEKRPHRRGGRAFLRNGQRHVPESTRGSDRTRVSGRLTVSAGPAQPPAGRTRLAGLRLTGRHTRDLESPASTRTSAGRRETPACWCSGFLFRGTK